MSSGNSNKKLLIKNSIALYLRMMLSILIGLYTSRIVLQVLGVDDYGIYNIVGGVVGLTSFINASMSSSTSRFITYELGRGNFESLQKTFSTALTIHVGIIILVLVLCETIGLWFVNNKVVLPAESLKAANWVYQMSILTTCITILQVPYNATIMAHEKMNVFAYIEILNSLLKLAVVFILKFLPLNKLELYSTLILLVSLIITSCYFIYGTYHFDECRFKITFEKTLFKPMLSYSGWDLFGNLSVTAKQQGGSVVLNLFYGVVANASAGIANVINGTILGFSQIVMTAFRPQIIKSYSSGAIDQFLQLTHLAFKIVLIFYAMISIPAFICMGNLLSLWLKNPPEFSMIFCRIMLLSGFFNLFSVVFITGLHATGKIKSMSLLGLICNFLTVIVAYVGYKIGAEIRWLYWCFCIFNAFTAFGCLIILKGQVSEIKVSRFLLDLLIIILCYSLIFIGSYIGYKITTSNFGSICTTCISSIILTGIVSSLFLLTPVQRKRIFSKLSGKIGISI